MADRTTPDPIPTLVHGTAVAVAGRALLIQGPSGSGKSALALRLIALGASLVADDQVVLTPLGHSLIASAPAALAGLIEARYLGVLALRRIESAPLVLIVDLTEPETERLPRRHFREMAGMAIPLVKASQIDHLAPALFCYLLGDRRD